MYSEPQEDLVLIAGAGLAGLAAAYRLQQANELPFVVFEKSQQTGGLSRTLEHGSFRFDLGGHRFYTKKQEVQHLVEELVGEDLLTIDRVSRILFRGRFVNYPLTGLSTLTALGPLGAVRAVGDYALMRLRNLLGGAESEETFEQWALNRFGRYLYEAYFKVYSEKTWGVPCTELSADFAEQRIKNLSFREAVKDALLERGEDESLVRQFYYPARGFGQIPAALAGVVEEPNRILTHHEVMEVRHEEDRVTGVTCRGPTGRSVEQPCRELISSLPLPELVRSLRPRAPEAVLRAADRLEYRSMVILFITLDAERVSPDHWVYVPSPEIGFCRLHEPKNWSPKMTPAGRTSLVLEYFCQEGDKRWCQPTARLAAEAAEDLQQIGLIDARSVVDSRRVLLPKAYPLYRVGYHRHLETINDYLDRFFNLHNVGRNAAFLYTSSDHYIDMGLKAAENLLGHEHDLGRVGREAGYAEVWQEGEKWS